ncbi:hypothetical protein SAMN05444365_1011044 [Micromonospora pattaloongensis]|uniref:Uncharacterized protein n=1 Tax=Micromonospora pattaloongensis TaxID=405436 RepID=A0A1H3HYU4_9ACTN|nr:hypothetical protein [Micromonospora pattaloongensis]SDY20562.1 hypothetical protein SAMN05444365_1011044 [Micromonospora pattaloongensis]
MAVRGWGAIASAIGIAAGAGAAQLGLGYGLGIVTWSPSVGLAGEATWIASLTWATWIGATSTVLGAVCAQALGAGRAPSPVAEDAPSRASAFATALWRTAVALAAGVGALVTVALVAVPARDATRADTFSPQTIAAGYAVVGVVVGLVIAVWALVSRAGATNVVATLAWLWLIAVLAVVHGALSGRGLTAAQLGVWEMTADSERFWFRNYFYWPGAALALGSALVIGALAAWPSARRSENRVGAAISGGVGPLLVAAAYFLAAPRLAGIRGEQLSAHLMAPYAVIAGLAGSVLVTALVQRAQPSPAPQPGPAAVAPERDEPAPSPAAAQGDSAARTDQPAPVYSPSGPAQSSGSPARGTASVTTAVRSTEAGTAEAAKAGPRRPARRPH